MKEEYKTGYIICHAGVYDEEITNANDESKNDIIKKLIKEGKIFFSLYKNSHLQRDLNVNNLNILNNGFFKYVSLKDKDIKAIASKNISIVQNIQAHPNNLLTKINELTTTLERSGLSFDLDRANNLLILNYETNQENQIVINKIFHCNLMKNSHEIKTEIKITNEDPVILTDADSAFILNFINIKSIEEKSPQPKANILELEGRETSYYTDSLYASAEIIFSQILKNYLGLTPAQWNQLSEKDKDQKIKFYQEKLNNFLKKIGWSEETENLQPPQNLESRKENIKQAIEKYFPIVDCEDLYDDNKKVSQMAIVKFLAAHSMLKRVFKGSDIFSGSTGYKFRCLNIKLTHFFPLFYHAIANPNDNFQDQKINIKNTESLFIKTLADCQISKYSDFENNSDNRNYSNQTIINNCINLMVINEIGFSSCFPGVISRLAMCIKNIGSFKLTNNQNKVSYYDVKCIIKGQEEIELKALIGELVEYYKIKQSKQVKLKNFWQQQRSKWEDPFVATEYENSIYSRGLKSIREYYDNEVNNKEQTSLLALIYFCLIQEFPTIHPQEFDRLIHEDNLYTLVEGLLGEKLQGDITSKIDTRISDEIKKQKLIIESIDEYGRSYRKYQKDLKELTENFYNAEVDKNVFELKHEGLLTDSHSSNNMFKSAIESFEKDKSNFDYIYVYKENGTYYKEHIISYALRNNLPPQGIKILLQNLNLEKGDLNKILFLPIDDYPENSVYANFLLQLVNIQNYEDREFIIQLIQQEYEINNIYKENSFKSKQNIFFPEKNFKPCTLEKVDSTIIKTNRADLNENFLKKFQNLIVEAKDNSKKQTLYLSSKNNSDELINFLNKLFQENTNKINILKANKLILMYSSHDDVDDDNDDVEEEEEVVAEEYSEYTVEDFKDEIALLEKNNVDIRNFIKEVKAQQAINDIIIKENILYEDIIENLVSTVNHNSSKMMWSDFNDIEEAEFITKFDQAITKVYGEIVDNNDYIDLVSQNINYLLFWSISNDKTQITNYIILLIISERINVNKEIVFDRIKKFVLKNLDDNLENITRDLIIDVINNKKISLECDSEQVLDNYSQKEVKLIKIENIIYGDESYIETIKKNFHQQHTLELIAKDNVNEEINKLDFKNLNNVNFASILLSSFYLEEELKNTKAYKFYQKLSTVKQLAIGKIILFDSLFNEIIKNKDTLKKIYELFANKKVLYDYLIIAKLNFIKETSIDVIKDRDIKEFVVKTNTNDLIEILNLLLVEEPEFLAKHNILPKIKWLYNENFPNIRNVNFKELVIKLCRKFNGLVFLTLSYIESENEELISDYIHFIEDALKGNLGAEIFESLCERNKILYNEKLSPFISLAFTELVKSKKFVIKPEYSQYAIYKLLYAACIVNDTDKVKEIISIIKHKSNYVYHTKFIIEDLLNFADIYDDKDGRVIRDFQNALILYYKHNKEIDAFIDILKSNKKMYEFTLISEDEEEEVKNRKIDYQNNLLDGNYELIIKIAQKLKSKIEFYNFTDICLLFNSHNQFAQNNWGLIEPTTIETFIEKLDDNEKLENNLNAMLCLIDNQNIKEVVNEVKQEITSAKADKLSPGNMQRLVKVLAENIPVIHKLVEIYKENQEGPEISELALQESIKTIENTKCQIEMKKDVSDNSWLLRDDYFIDKEIENLQSTLSPNKLISSRYKSPQHNESQGTISLKGENSIVYIRNHKDIDPEELNLLSAIKEKMKQYVTVVERAIDEASGEGGDDFENVSSIEDETSGEKANFYDDFDDYDDDEVISDEEERQDTVSNDEVSFKSETSGAKKNFDDDIQNSDNDYDDDIQVSDDELFIPDEKKRQEPVSIDEGSFEDKIIGANPKDYHDIEDFDDDKFIPDKEKGGKHVYNYAGHRVDRKRVSSNHNNKQINPYNPTIEHKNFEANTNSTKNEITSFKDKILKKNNLKYLVSGAATGGLSGVATFALMTKKSRNYVDNLIGIKFLNHQMVRILLINAAIFLPIIASIIFIISKELYNSNKLVKNNIEDLDKNNEPGGCSRI